MCRILLVEDDPGDARLLRESLAEAGRVYTALTHVTRLSEGLQRIEAEHFDVVLLDLSLPDGGGVETVQRLCTVAPDMPVVVLTGLDDEALALKALEMGAQDYLVKGEIDGRWLMRAIQYAIERHRMQTTLRSLTLIDDLTGLYNRRGFLTLAEQQVKAARRANLGLWLLFVDVDGLKRINDTFGHSEGDRALQAVAAILRQTFRDSDICARLGGDEFTVLAMGADPGSGHILRRRLQEQVAAYNRRSPLPYALALSAGVVRADPSRLSSIEQSIAEADQALYHEKRHRQAEHPSGSFDPPQGVGDAAGPR